MDALRCDRCKVKFESRDQLAMHMLDHSYTPEEEAMSANNEERSKLTAAELLDMRKRGLMANMTNSLHELMSANMQDLIAGYTNSESKCEICFKVRFCQLTLPYPLFCFLTAISNKIHYLEVFVITIIMFRDLRKK